MFFAKTKNGQPSPKEIQSRVRNKNNKNRYKEAPLKLYERNTN